MDNTLSFEPKISPSVKWLMLGFAIFLDTLGILIQLIPAAGQILATCIGIFGQLLFWFWFTINGVTFNTKKALRFFGTNILELIPFINALPALTTSVILTLHQVKKDDEIAFDIAQKQQLEEMYPVSPNEDILGGEYYSSPPTQIPHVDHDTIKRI